jgi:hypothetical protein
MTFRGPLAEVEAKLTDGGPVCVQGVLDSTSLN